MDLGYVFGSKMDRILRLFGCEESRMLATFTLEWIKIMFTG